METNHRRPSKHRLEEHDMLNWFKSTKKQIAKGDYPQDRLEKFAILMRVADKYHRKNQYEYGNVYKGTYRRNNEGDYHCTEAQVKAMIRDSNADGNDSILIEYYGMDDIDPDSLRQYRTEFRQENSTHVWNQVDDKTFLRNLGGYTEDRQTGREGLTLAGLMMFGKGLAIRDRFSNFRMDYLDMSHLVGDERYHDRLTYDGLWENNLGR